MHHLIVVVLVGLSLNIAIAAEGPVCRNVDGEMGWVLTNGRFVLDKNCEGKEVVCAAIGTRSEGWYAREDMPVYDYQNGTEALRCDSAYGRELLELNYREYFCKDEYVYDSDYELLEYHLDCQFPKYK
ncbi:MAG: hypothetical protein A2X86_21300 [Bdellovibrionales bacterium GWA2_49_15]|nr:MAG: hypothetical protein A2X86_21300 [Bdellovibrionales bacterium GWA2_49_15]HAZ14916.1 hypothetical protein [Bdellovibrionales bacterium]